MSKPDDCDWCEHPIVDITQKTTMWTLRGEPHDKFLTTDSLNRLVDAYEADRNHYHNSCYALLNEQNHRDFLVSHPDVLTINFGPTGERIVTLE